MSTLGQIRFRSARTDDVTILREITRAAYAKWVPLIGREPMPMKVDYETAGREHRFELLQVDGDIVGLVEFMLPGDHLWIENVAVRPEVQGKGFGRSLMAHVEALAREAGRGELRLLTNEAFADNVAIYRKLGYGITRTEPFMGGTTLYMSKMIPLVG